jgi:hypothetical protein
MVNARGGANGVRRTRRGALALAAAVLLLAAVALGARAPRAGARNPLASSIALPAGERFEVEGDVVERLEAGPYVYLDVRDGAGGRHWVASLAATVPAGAGRVRVTVLGRAAGFHSRRLARRFELLLFAVVQSNPEKVP